MAVALARLFYMMQGINPMTDSTKPRTLKDQLESETADTERSAAVDSERYHGGDWWQLTDAEESVFGKQPQRRGSSLSQAISVRSSISTSRHVVLLFPQSRGSPADHPGFSAREGVMKLPAGD
jgi:hypothetical protein